jgi:hypothetical protein
MLAAPVEMTEKSEAPATVRGRYIRKMPLQSPLQKAGATTATAKKQVPRLRLPAQAGDR